MCFASFILMFLHFVFDGAVHTAETESTGEEVRDEVADCSAFISERTCDSG
jgi:hypothetical protein